MPTVRELITRIAFKVEEGRLRAANVAVGNIKKHMRSTRREVWKLNRSINTMALGMKAAAAAYIGSRFVKMFTTDMSQGADEVGKFSKATGIATDFIQRFDHAAGLGGATVRDTRNGIKRFTRVVNDAKNGLKTAQRSFEQIGLDPKQIKADEEGLLQIADAFKNMKDDGKRAAVAQELFGRTGLNLIPVLKGGRVELQRYLREADKLGIVLSKKQIEAAEKFNDELTRSKAVFRGVRNQIANRLLPIITKNLVAFKEWATEGDNLAEALDTVKKAAIAATVAFIALKATKLGIAFAAALPALKTAAILLGGVARAAAAAAAPLLVPLGIIAALALAIEDLVRFARGEGSLIGDMFGDTAEGQEVKDLLLEIAKVFMGMRDSFREVNVEFLKLFKGIVKAFGQIVKALLPILLRTTILLLRVVLWLTKALAWAVDKLVKAFNWLVDALSPVGDAFTWIGEKASEAAAAIAGAFTWAADRVSEAWDGTIGWLGELWDGIVSTAKTVGAAIAAPFVWAAGKVKAGWNAAIGWIKKLVDGIADKIRAVSDMIARVTGKGTGRFGGIAGGIEKAVAGAGAAAGKTENNLRVGQVAVTVSGSNLTPEQLQKAVSGSVSDALNIFAGDLVGNRKPLVEGAPG